MDDNSALRADAQKNRERILAAAEEMFLEQGTGVSLEDVAKRAGVGIGTLYRRFPTREALLAGASNARFLSVAETSRLRGAKLDSSQALRAFLDDLIKNTNLYQSLALSLGAVLESGTPGCNAITAEGERLLRCGQEAGSIRQDVTFDDLVHVVVAISLSVERSASSRSRVPHLIDLLFQGIGIR
ncbi:MAG: TetR/AcrR family transcriptional regulator [Brevundimonas sp.]|uniref:TetR/AcrR family transcriptional regulator n=1 Tax=Brevundimonas sp. TaxID=1871086 RepID=UPI003919F7ED